MCVITLCLPALTWGEDYTVDYLPLKYTLNNKYELIKETGNTDASKGELSLSRTYINKTSKTTILIFAATTSTTEKTSNEIYKEIISGYRKT